VVVLNQQIAMPGVAVGPEVQVLALMQVSESHQIFREVRLFMVREAQGAETQFSALPKQPALELARDLMQ
jgi:hypothetical protein